MNLIVIILPFSKCCDTGLCEPGNVLLTGRPRGRFGTRGYKKKNKTLNKTYIKNIQNKITKLKVRRKFN